MTSIGVFFFVIFSIIHSSTSQETDGTVVSGNSRVDPIEYCKNLAQHGDGNEKDENNCKFFCTSAHGVEQWFYQPSGISCGEDKVCHFGECYSTKAYQKCKESAPSFTYIEMGDPGTCEMAKCYYHYAFLTTVYEDDGHECNTNPGSDIGKCKGGKCVDARK